jgi:hypothetical protein
MRIWGIDSPVEINGFKVLGDLDVDCSTGITVVNNTFSEEEFSTLGMEVNMSEVTVMNNIFQNEETAMHLSQSSIVSVNNNYCLFASWGDDSSTVSSTGDYFTYQGFASPTAYADGSGGPNSGYYGVSLTLEYTPKATSSPASSFSQEAYMPNVSPYDNAPKNINYEENASLLKNLLNNKDALMSNGGVAGEVDQATLAKIVGDALGKNAFAVPIDNRSVTGEQMEIANALARILKDPTEVQKVMINALTALLNDTEKVAEDAATKGNPELKKAENDLLQAVANLLLAQAMPDLIKKGDIAGIKTMFSDLDTAKTKLMNDYAKSTRPYYDNMLKDLARNLAMLQLKNILNPNMSKDELEKLPPSELDKILEKIKQQKDKAFEEEYLLQQEAKYRKTYIDPNKQKLEEDMKNMLNDFTKKINGALK